MTNPDQLLARLDELSAETGAPLERLRRFVGFLVDPAGCVDQHGIARPNRWPATRAVWTSTAATEKEALDDLLTLWVAGLRPGAMHLAMRWLWSREEAAALMSTAEGIATEWGIR